MYVDAQQKHIHSVKADKTLSRTREYIDKGRSLQKLRTNIAEAQEMMHALTVRVQRLTDIADKKKRHAAIYAETNTLCAELKASLHLLSQLRGRVDVKNESLEEEMKQMRSILTPKQAAKFILWVSHNRTRSCEGSRNDAKPSP